MPSSDIKPVSGRKRSKALNVAAIDDIIGYRLRRAQNNVFQQFGERFARHALRPSEYSVIVLIEDNPGRRQNEIADCLGIKKANFVALVRGLAERGFIDLDRPAHDKRAHALFLTPAGVELARQIRETQDEFETHCVEMLGGIEARDQLIGLLERLSPPQVGK